MSVLIGMGLAATASGCGAMKTAVSDGLNGLRDMGGDLMSWVEGLNGDPEVQVTLSESDQLAGVRERGALTVVIFVDETEVTRVDGLDMIAEQLSSMDAGLMDAGITVANRESLDALRREIEASATPDYSAILEVVQADFAVFVDIVRHRTTRERRGKDNEPYYKSEFKASMRVVDILSSVNIASSTVMHDQFDQDRDDALVEALEGALEALGNQTGRVILGLPQLPEAAEEA